MDDDPPPGDVELLDEWDDDLPAPRRRTKTWMLGPLALVAVGAILVAVVLGGTKRAALTDSSSPPAPPSVTSGTSSSYPAPTSWATVDATLPSGATTYRVEASGGGGIMVVPEEAYTPGPIPSDAEAEPLVVSLLERVDSTDSATVAFKVMMCVPSGRAALGGGKVRISRSGWMLGLVSGMSAPMSAGGRSPAFPETALLDAGQCVSGYLTFALPVASKYLSLYYNDDRFMWGWRVS